VIEGRERGKEKRGQVFAIRAIRWCLEFMRDEMTEMHLLVYQCRRPAGAPGTRLRLH
jgi:hypothetical protein